MKKLIGSITFAKLNAWIEDNRPELGLYSNDGARGFYRRDAGPAASFQAVGRTWRDVAARLGAVEVAEDEA